MSNDLNNRKKIEKYEIQDETYIEKESFSYINSILQPPLRLTSIVASTIAAPYIWAGRTTLRAASYAIHIPLQIINTTVTPNVHSFCQTEKNDIEIISEKPDIKKNLIESTKKIGKIPFNITYNIVYTVSYPLLYAGNVSCKAAKIAFIDIPNQVLTTSIFSNSEYYNKKINYPTNKIIDNKQMIQIVPQYPFNISKLPKNLSYYAVNVTKLTVEKASHVTFYCTTKALSTAYQASSFSIHSIGKMVPHLGHLSFPMNHSYVQNSVHKIYKATNYSISFVEYSTASCLVIPTYQFLKISMPNDFIQQIPNENQLIHIVQNTLHNIGYYLGPQNFIYFMKFIYNTCQNELFIQYISIFKKKFIKYISPSTYKQIGSHIKYVYHDTLDISKMKESLNIYYECLPEKEEIKDLFSLLYDIANETFQSIHNSNGMEEKTNTNAEIQLEEEEGKIQLFDMCNQEDVNNMNTISQGEVNNDDEYKNIEYISDTEKSVNESIWTENVFENTRIDKIETGISDLEKEQEDTNMDNNISNIMDISINKLTTILDSNEFAETINGITNFFESWG